MRGAGGAFGIGVGGSSGGGLHEQNLSHRAAQLEEERRKATQYSSSRHYVFFAKQLGKNFCAVELFGFLFK